MVLKTLVLAVNIKLYKNQFDGFGVISGTPTDGPRDRMILIGASQGYE